MKKFLWFGEKKWFQKNGADQAEKWSDRGKLQGDNEAERADREGRWEVESHFTAKEVLQTPPRGREGALASESN